MPIKYHLPSILCWHRLQSIIMVFAQLCIYDTPPQYGHPTRLGMYNIPKPSSSPEDAYLYPNHQLHQRMHPNRQLHQRMHACTQTTSFTRGCMLVPKPPALPEDACLHPNHQLYLRMHACTQTTSFTWGCMLAPKPPASPEDCLCPNHQLHQRMHACIWFRGCYLVSWLRHLVTQ